MPVPWEALIPFGNEFDERLKPLLTICPALVTAMFGTAGTLLNVSQRAQNQGKVCIFALLPNYLPLSSFQSPRYHIDAWEEMMMERDKRLTGHARGQSVCVRLLFSGVKI